MRVRFKTVLQNMQNWLCNIGLCGKHAPTELLDWPVSGHPSPPSQPCTHLSTAASEASEGLIVSTETGPYLKISFYYSHQLPSRLLMVISPWWLEKNFRPCCLEVTVTKRSTGYICSDDCFAICASRLCSQQVNSTRPLLGRMQISAHHGYRGANGWTHRYISWDARLRCVSLFLIRSN